MIIRNPMRVLWSGGPNMYGLHLVQLVDRGGHLIAVGHEKTFNQAWRELWRRAPKGCQLAMVGKA